MSVLPMMALGGAVAGILGSMLGLGGGFMIVPMLTILFGMPMHTAIAAGQIGVIATSSVSAAIYMRRRLVHVRAGLLLEIGTTVGALTGALIGSSLNPWVLSIVFGGVLLFVAWRMIAGSRNIEDEEITAEACRIERWWVGHLGAYSGGALSGLLGIGGGVVNVPVFCLGMGIPIKVAAATSSFMIGITGVTAAIVYYSKGHTDLVVTGATTVGVFLGSLVGSKVAARVKSRYLRLVFSLVAVYTAFVMISKGLSAVL